MRKQIDGLCTVIAERMKMNPQNGDIYVFFSYAADRVKLLFWDGTGFVLVYKRIDSGYFEVPKYIGKHVQINHSQLAYLLQGVIDEYSVNPGLQYNDYF